MEVLHEGGVLCLELRWLRNVSGAGIFEQRLKGTEGVRYAHVVLGGASAKVLKQKCTG